MGIQQKLHTKLVQKLILTPSLQQAIKLLPMSTLELSDLLNQEMVENPMLEEVPTEELQPAEAAPAQEKADPEQQTNKTDTWDDQDYEYFFGDYLDDGYRPKAPQEVKELPPIENTLSTASSLSDHLIWQLSMQTEDSVLRDIGSAIIGNLDDDGYLVASFDELAAMGPWPVSEVERALKLVQGFDPTGVAARDLQECLLLQLRHLGLDGTPTEKVVTDHLRLLQNHQVPEIARKLGMTIDDLKEHIEVIRHLDPKPGSRYNPTQSQYVIPDVYVMKVEDEYVAVLNEDGLPQMRISPVYRRLLDKSASDNTDETRAYVKDKFRSALWLIKSVEQRQKTIFKVAKSIINFQKDFLDHGIEHLRPLVLRDVANDIGMHESTVSRVVTNKYMHTPQGVFEMKYFFHSGISSSYGESVSSVTIKQRIRKIIENEDPRKPLSDSKIVSILQREGLVLARRTIAKYREELKIPTSNQTQGVVLGGPERTALQRPPRTQRITCPREGVSRANPYATRTQRPSRRHHPGPSAPGRRQARQDRTAAQRSRRLGEGHPHHREAPPPREHHAARARREVPARRGRDRQVGNGGQRGRRGDLAAGAEGQEQAARSHPPRRQDRRRRRGGEQRAGHSGPEAGPGGARGSRARANAPDPAGDAAGDQADVGGRRRPAAGRRRRRHRRLP